MSDILDIALPFIIPKGDKGDTGAQGEVPAAALATKETSTTASKAYSVGDYLYYNSKLYRVTASIASGGTITPNTNCVEAALADDVTNVKNQLITDSLEQIVEYPDYTRENGYYINKNGNKSSSDSYYYLMVDNLSEGDKVVVWVKYQQGSSIVLPTFRFVCAYNSSGSAVSASGAENVTDGAFTIPSGITKVALTITSSNPNVWDVTVLKNKKVADIKTNPQIKTRAFSGDAISKTGNLSASSSLTLTTNSIYAGKTICFYGLITSFNSIDIYQGFNPPTDTNSMGITVDDTNLTIHRYQTDDLVKPHGLTISDFISVVIATDSVGNPTYSISTNGGMYKETINTAWAGKMSNIVVETDASTSLTDCKFSCVYYDIRFPVWVFGDSYVGTGESRFPYWLKQRGITEFLINGHGGETSPYAVSDLKNLLTIGTPHTIVWDMGMNDADSSGGINTAWQAALNEMIALANSVSANVILCTIPNTPSKRNTYKNAIVKASGYPYIDFAKAVNAESANATWYSGMLSSDNIHPTEDGAIALADAVIKDFPYICNLCK